MTEITTNKKVKLSSFIEDNHKLLTTLGVFVALTVFANNLSLKWIGYVLSFLFLNAAILIMLEILGKFPSDKLCSGRLWWFEHLIILSMLTLVAYWFLAFPRFWDHGEIVSAFILLGLLTIAWKLGKHSKIFSFLFPAKFTPLKILRTVLIMGIALFALAVISVLLSSYLFKWLNKISSFINSKASP